MCTLLLQLQTDYTEVRHGNGSHEELTSRVTSHRNANEDKDCVMTTNRMAPLMPMKEFATATLPMRETVAPLTTMMILTVKKT